MSNNHMISLQYLLAELPFSFTSNIQDVQVSGISIDSRAIRPGYLFVAMKGGSVDGHDFIHKAIDNGAVVVMGDREMDLDRLSVPYIRLQNPRQALTWLSAAFYNWPARKLTVIGVTGTDGKTTTSNLIYKILVAAGIKAGMISTVNAVIGDEVLDTGFHVTTPDAHDVQRYLAKMVEAGLTHVVLETTSHGWAQYRVDACEFDVGVVTNITHEHMDEHGNYENYRAAKSTGTPSRLPSPRRADEGSVAFRPLVAAEPLRPSVPAGGADALALVVGVFPASAAADVDRPLAHLAHRGRALRHASPRGRCRSRCRRGRWQALTSAAGCCRGAPRRSGGRCSCAGRSHRGCRGTRDRP